MVLSNKDFRRSQLGQKFHFEVSKDVQKSEGAIVIDTTLLSECHRTG